MFIRFASVALTLAKKGRKGRSRLQLCLYQSRDLVSAALMFIDYEDKKAMFSKMQPLSALSERVREPVTVTNVAGTCLV